VIPGESGRAGRESGRAQRSGADAEASFDRLVAAYTPRLFRIVRRFASDAGEAEALVQETWLRAWKAFPQVDASRPLLPWLARIAVNAARDAWRRARPVDFADLGEEIEARDEDQVGPELSMERSELLERLALGVARLRTEYRVVIALRYDAQLSYEEIARNLSVPLNTVRTHLRRAKAELLAWLETSDD
jgi:RNA polymerase sigma-70 factor (ECF subfamily)